MSSYKRKYELIVFGYIRNILSLTIPNAIQMPMELKQLCVLFYALNVEWDTTLHGENMIIVEGGNCIKMLCRGWGSAYLTEEYSSNIDIHHFKFKIETGPDPSFYFLFGIWKINSGEPILNRYFTDKQNNGYALDATDGELTDPNNPGCNGKDYAIGCNEGDIIDQYIDFNKLLLTFAINGEYYSNGQEIENTVYKVAVTMNRDEDMVRFISYDNKPFDQDK